MILLFLKLAAGHLQMMKGTKTMHVQPTQGQPGVVSALVMISILCPGRTPGCIQLQIVT